MKIELDFWVTPDGYSGTAGPGQPVAHRVKGTVEVTDYSELLSIVGGKVEGFPRSLVRRIMDRVAESKRRARECHPGDCDPDCPAQAGCPDGR